MLEKLLDEIRLGGTTQPALLAARLNVSVGMVQIMLADLERLGYLQPVDTCSQGSCSGCPFGDSCSPGGGAKVWVVK